MSIDFSGLVKRWSTWLAVLSAMAVSGIGAYAIMPVRIQAQFPDWALAAIGAISVISALLIPLATSIRQSSLKR